MTYLATDRECANWVNRNLHLQVDAHQEVHELVTEFLAACTSGSGYTWVMPYTPEEIQAVCDAAGT